MTRNIDRETTGKIERGNNRIYLGIQKERQIEELTGKTTRQITGKIDIK